MDILQTAAMLRARDAVQFALDADGPSSAVRAKAFVEAACVVASSRPGDELAALQRSANTLIAKAAAASTLDAVWASPEGAAVANAFLASTPERNLLDELARYARPLAGSARAALVASGWTANAAVEGGPKVVRNQPLHLADAEPLKVASIVVITNELLKMGGEAGRRLFEMELVKAVTRASNAAVLSSLDDSNATHLPSTGDALGDLRAGLRAAEMAAGYVVAGEHGLIADLATRSANRNAGILGGEFIAGVSLVAVEGMGGLHVIPAGRFGLYLGPMQLRGTGQGNVNMADNPTAQSTVVSLFQTDSWGLIAERDYHIAAAAGTVVVGGGS